MTITKTQKIIIVVILIAVATFLFKKKSSAITTKNTNKPGTNSTKQPISAVDFDQDQDGYYASTDLGKEVIQSVVLLFGDNDRLLSQTQKAHSDSGLIFTFRPEAFQDGKLLVASQFANGEYILRWYRVDHLELTEVNDAGIDLKWSDIGRIRFKGLITFLNIQKL